jgi:hypothetical protein
LLPKAAYVSQAALMQFIASALPWLWERGESESFAIKTNLACDWNISLAAY